MLKKNAAQPMRMQDFQTQQKSHVTEARHNADEALLFCSKIVYITIYIVDLQDVAWLTKVLLRGKYQEVLKSNIVEWVFGKESERSLDENFSQVIEDNVEKYMKDAVGTSRLIQ